MKSQGNLDITLAPILLRVRRIYSFKKHLLLILILQSSLISNQIYGQSKGEKIGAVAAGVATAGVAALVVWASYEDYKNQLEHWATEYWLSAHPEVTSFELKLGPVNENKWKNRADASIISFNVRNLVNGELTSVWFITSYNWYNEFGLDFNRINVIEFNQESWSQFLVKYLSLVSGNDQLTSESIQVKIEKSEKNPEGATGTLSEESENGEIEYFSVYSVPVVNIQNLKSKQIIFSVADKKASLLVEKLDSRDIYKVREYMDGYRLVYSLKEMMLYQEQTRDLISIHREGVEDVTKFIFD
jgi:hypothetical protein